jgi:hypothetical protein
MAPERTVIQVLADHAWQCRSDTCQCGWMQRSLPRGVAQLNHPHHVADMLALAGLLRLP